MIVGCAYSIRAERKSVTQSSRFTAIDLAGLVPPDIIEELDFEVILSEAKDDVVARMRVRSPSIDFDVYMLESEPIVKVLETQSYRETIIRSRINTACRAIMLAYAQQHDLDHLGAYYSTGRAVVTPADIAQNIAAVMEDDTRYRRRVQIAPEAFSTAGPAGAYEYHTLAVDPSIKDVGVYSSAPGIVDVLPLTNAGDGMPSNDLIEAVRLRLADPKISPLTDVKNVRKPIKIEYTIDVTLKLAEGPDPVIVELAARDSLSLYAASRHYVGMPVYWSGIVTAAKVDGVEKVTMTNQQDILVSQDNVCYCTEINIAIA